METFKEQLKANLVALISLVVAIVAMVSSSWREDETEKNRNTRAASFEVLKNLAELQIVVNNSYYLPKGAMANPFSGWGQMALINDLARLLSPKVMEKSAALAKEWNEQWEKVKTDESAVNAISEKINEDRDAVLELLKSLK